MSAEVVAVVLAALFGFALSWICDLTAEKWRTWLLIALFFAYGLARSAS